MHVDRINTLNSVPGVSPEGRKPNTPEEAARQFEQVLVKQMIGEMTEEMFDSSLAGDDAPQWMGSYNDMQSDMLATELAKQLTENGRLGIADMLMKQWERQGYSPTDKAASAAETIKTEEQS